MIDTHKNGHIRALGLCSGGLDSMLAALVLRDQGIEIEWITFETPFFSSENARQAAEQLGIPITVNHITSVYLDMLKNPPVGYGKHMNPCMDCHSLMFRLAGEVIKERKFDFLFSGEVLGQRPMSQTRSSLRYVEKHSGYEGYIVRPLSAKHLPETLPEKEGWVNRELLLNITGKSRKPQIKLAQTYGIANYPAPAGGCLLTDKGFSRRLKDLFEHQNEYSENDLNLLKQGRHIRISKEAKIIVGRNHQDNERILKHYRSDKDILIKMSTLPGPIVLLPNGGDRDIVFLSASICAGYGKTVKGASVKVMVETPHVHEIISVIAIQPKEIRGLLL